MSLEDDGCASEGDNRCIYLNNSGVCQNAIIVKGHWAMTRVSQRIIADQ